MIKYNDLGGIKRLFLILLFVFLFLSVSSKSVFAGNFDSYDKVYNDIIYKLESIYNGDLECENDKWCKAFENYKILRSEPFKYYTVYSVIRPNESNNLELFFEGSTNPFNYISEYDTPKLYSSISSDCSYFSLKINISEDYSNYSLSIVYDISYNSNFIGTQNGRVYGISDIIWTNHDIYDLENNLIYKVKYDFKDVLYFLRFIFHNIFIISGVVLDFILSSNLLILYHGILILIFIIFLLKKIRR